MFLYTNKLIVKIKTNKYNSIGVGASTNATRLNNLQFCVNCFSNKFLKNNTGDKNEKVRYGYF